MSRTALCLVPGREKAASIIASGCQCLQTFLLCEFTLYFSHPSISIFQFPMIVQKIEEGIENIVVYLYVHCKLLKLYNQCT